MKKTLLLALALIIGGAFIALNSQTLDLATLRTAVGDLNDWRQSNAALFSALFFAAYVIVTALSLPLAVWMTKGDTTLECYCRTLYLVVWETTKPGKITMCDAPEQARLAAEAKGA